MKTEETIRKITDGIRMWFDSNGPTASAVVGISGGKDSAIVAKLLVEALGKDRVKGVLMPNGEQPDIDDSFRICELLGIEYFVVNISEAVEGLEKQLKTLMPLSRDSKINLPPRIRMATLYSIAQSLPGGGRVINTCNRSEDYIGYSTKYGDAAGDVSVLGSFTVSEVLQIGDALGLPYELVHKTPSDGLSGQTDEDKLGFTYEMLDNYILNGVCEDADIKSRIDRLHEMNLHKMKPVPIL